MRPVILTAALAVPLIAFAGCGPQALATKMAGPSPYEGDPDMETATFAAGCFWGVEATFQNVEGVKDTTVGYTGGHTDNPTYKQVCAGNTGHAEAVQVIYDPEKVSYEDLLGVFWKAHDPTQVNRQGPDVGDQYRSGVFYHSDAQKEAAEASKKSLDESGKLRKPVATEITEASRFWPAEEYHQRYLEKRGMANCHI